MRMRPMLNDWNSLSDDLQLMLASQAMAHAVQIIAGQAETLAEEMEAGGLSDRGGPDALRLLAAVVRVAGQETAGPMGHA